MDRCPECGTDYPAWFTDNPLWNTVLGGPTAMDDPGGMLCPLCFAKKAETVHGPIVWRFIPVWRQS